MKTERWQDTPRGQKFLQELRQAAKANLKYYYDMMALAEKQKKEKQKVDK